MKSITDADVVRRWAFSPESFVREALRVDLPWPFRVGGSGPTPQQLEGLEAVRQLIVAKRKARRGEPVTNAEQTMLTKRGLSIMSGVGTGKDAFAAWIVLWFLFCWPRAKLLCVAPTQHQLRDVLWSEISKWMRHSDRAHSVANTGFKLTDWLTWQTDKVFFTEHGGQQWFAVGRTANPRSSPEEQAETLAGFHEEHAIVLVDEASGVPDPVFRPLETTLTGIINFALLLFNPTRAKGFALDTHREQTAHWVTLRWNAEDSPLTSPDSTAYIVDKYGIDSNAYRIRVLGLPPLEDDDILIPWDLVTEAVGRELEPLDDDPWVLGIDVARFGSDLSVILPRRGPLVAEPLVFSGLDTEQLTGWAMAEILEREPAYVFVDAIGIGAGVADKLRHRCARTTVIDVIASEVPATFRDRYHRLRDELWWRLRERFYARTISIPDNRDLIDQLTTPRYEMRDGKIVIESKKSMKGRGHPSPNHADALVMTEYYDTEWVRAARHPQRTRPAAVVSWRVA